MILRTPQRPKKRFLLFLFLSILATIIFFIVQNKRINLNLDFSFLTQRGIVNPLLPPTDEEKLRELLEKSGFQVKEIGMTNNFLEATVSGNLEILFQKEKDYFSQVASLQFVLNRSKIEGKIPKRIDLRYNKPVLIY